MCTLFCQGDVYYGAVNTQLKPHVQSEAHYSSCFAAVQPPLTNNKTVPKLIAHVSTCNQREITEIKAMISEIQTSQMKDHEKAILKEIESVATIKSLREENNEMASEIALLKSTISELLPIMKACVKFST